jgi:hypothetical protein
MRRTARIALAIKEQMRERGLIDVRVYGDGIRIRLLSPADETIMAG